ncbi:MAG TPA: hypothetical protein VG055_34070 [Planctomycetaceae bacterium]|nr:hypothetical protein [Planctomycetaceae bacterium]
MSERAVCGFPFPRAPWLKSHWLAPLIATALAIAPGFSAADSSREVLNAGTLTATGRVLFPDGSPAADVIVSVPGNNIEPGLSVRSDAKGQFQLRHVFGTRCGIHAHAPDWRLQSTFSVPTDRARLALKQPLELKLQPARQQRVLVKSGGHPAKGVLVAAIHPAFKTEGRTGPDGEATVWLPQGRDWDEIAAWDPKLGGAEKYCMGLSPPPGVVELSLLAPKPRVIRVIDERMRPMRDLPFTLRCNTCLSEYFSAYEFEGARVRTDSRAEVTVPWLPADISSIDLGPPGPRWRKMDHIFMPSKASHGVMTVQVRGSHAVSGRLIMAGGAAGEGILVKGMGFGDGHNLDITSTRVRPDGTFTLLAASDCGYVVEICDDQWTCNAWTGVLLPKRNTDPARITLQAYAATPLTVRVTRGPQKEPWTNLVVNVEQRTTFQWTNSRGELQHCAGGMTKEPKIEADGTARVGVRPGECELSFRSGAWTEMRSLNVDADKPASVTLHRPWKDQKAQEVAGHLTEKGRPYRPTSATALRAWSTGAHTLGTPAVTRILPDGRFTIAPETEHACVYAIDSPKGLNAFRLIDPKDYMANLELALVPMGFYSGQVIDEAGKPAAACRVQLVATLPPDQLWSDKIVLCETQCDAQGRYRFDRAPTGVRVWAVVVVPATEFSPARLHRIAGHSLLLEPAGRREGDRLRLVLEEQEDPNPRPLSRRYESAADRLAELTRDSAACDLRVLVGATGDLTDAVEETWLDLVDESRVNESLRYLPIWVPADELRAQSRLFSQLNLRQPKAGEILLVALDGHGKRLDFLYVAVRSDSSVFRLGLNFLRRHSAPTRNAQKLVEAARHQAQASGRRVWIIAGDSRRENYFRLARWLQNQHDLLDRDYVFVKLLKGCDDNVDELGQALHLGDKNAPWFALTDAAGTVLAASNGPLGSPTDTKRQLGRALQATARRLTPTDIERLIRSFGA